MRYAYLITMKRICLDHIGILFDGKIYDCQSVNENIVGEPILPNGSKESLEILRHSTAHLMAQAIKEIYPEAQFFCWTCCQ